MLILRWFFAFFIFWSFILSGFNFLVDPIQFYRIDKNPTFLKNMRYQIPGLIKQYPFDTILIGTSHSANFIPSELDLLIGTESLNLSVNGSSGWEQKQIAFLALETSEVRNVIWEVNYRTIGLDASERVSSGIFPLHLYEGALDSHFLYLYSTETTWQSLKRLAGIGHKEIGTINSWESKFSHLFDGRHVKKHYCFRLQQTPRASHVNDYSSAIEDNIEPLVEGFRSTHFHFFLPPLSVFNYMLFDERYRFMKLRSEMYEFAGRHHNVSLYDFNTYYEWLENPLLYKDVEHYSPQISSRILNIIAEGREFVRDDNARSVNNEFDERISAFELGDVTCL